MQPSFESTPNISSADSNPQFFRAVQYVLGELSATEQEVFEMDLLDDESLCAMVAEATQFVCSVQQALVESAPVTVTVLGRESQASDVKRDRWTVAVVMAAASIMAAFGLANFSASSPSSMVAMKNVDAVKLVALWRSTGRTVVGSSLNDGPFESEAAAIIHDDRVPPWMMAAVSLEHRQRPTALPESDEAWEDN